MADTDPQTPKPKIDRVPSQFSTNLPLEICFLAFVGILTVASFFEALTYAIVSARTPFVIMVPLFALIALHAVRLYRARQQADIAERLLAVVRGHMTDFNKVLVLSGWFVAILVMIVLFGHYVGVFVFAFLLMWYAGKETLLLSAIVAVCSTLFVYLVFEVAFDIEFYRGLIVRYFQGYRDFG